MSDKATQAIFRQANMNFLLHFLRWGHGIQGYPWSLEHFRYKNNRPDGWTCHQMEKTIGDLIEEGLVELVPDGKYTNIVPTPKESDANNDVE